MEKNKQLSSMIEYSIKYLAKEQYESMKRLYDDTEMDARGNPLDQSLKKAGITLEEYHKELIEKAKFYLKLKKNPTLIYDPEFMAPEISNLTTAFTVLEKQMIRDIPDFKPNVIWRLLFEHE